MVRLAEVLVKSECDYCGEEFHRFGRFAHFRPGPEKSDRRTSTLSDLNDPPQGLLWPETGRICPWADSSSCYKNVTDLAGRDRQGN